MKIIKTCIVAVLLVVAASAVGGPNPSTLVATNSPPASSTNSPSHPVPSPPGFAKLEGIYEGPWVTTKSKKLNGTLKAQVKQLTPERWQGHFWGVWQQVPLDYTVEFTADLNANDGRSKPEERGGKVDPGATRSAGQKTNDQTDSMLRTKVEIPVMGTAMIDGASYQWTGKLSVAEFNIQFTGNRYEGHLELKRVPEKKATPVSANTNRGL